MDSNAEIGQRLEEWIKELGKKKGEVAAMLGISLNQLSQILKGRNGIGRVMITRLKSIGADVDYIMTGKRLDSEADFLLKHKDKVIASLRSENASLRKELDSMREKMPNFLALVAESEQDYKKERNHVEDVDTEVIENPIRRAQRVAATPIHVKKSKD